MVAHSARSIPEVGGAGRSERSFCIEVLRLGPETWPLYRVERWPHIRGFVSTVLYGDAFGTKVSGRHRECGRLYYQGWPLRGVPLYNKWLL